MKKIIKKIPIIALLFRAVKAKVQKLKFPGSEKYWESVYRSGGNSGEGSYNKLADFKAEVINKFIERNQIKSMIEFGCGDGNQLGLGVYPNYLGFDVSSKAISICNEKFRNDPTKKFKLASKYSSETAQLVISLDVIYHLVEDTVFALYMNNLFNASKKFVIIYSSNFSDLSDRYDPHVKHREFTSWVSLHQKEWKLLEHIPNRFPFEGDFEEGSTADFFIYGKLL